MEKNLGDYPYGYPIGDINNDGRNDIVAMSHIGIIFAFDGLNSDTLWTTDVGSGVGYLTAVIVDINGDGNLEVILGKTSGPLYALNGTNGEELWKVPQSVYSRVVIADVMGDDKAEVIAGTRSLAVLGWTADITLPVTTINLSGVLGDNDWFTSNVMVTLSTTDDIEVDKTEYSFDNATWITYATSFTITNEGNTIVYYKSTDKAGNTETIKTKTVKIDTTPPVIIITSPGSGYEIKSSTLTVTWTGSDGTSGISHYEIRLDDRSWINVGENTSHTFTELEDGSHTIEVKAIDNAGLTLQDSVDFIVNTSPPLEPSYTEVAVILATTIIVAIGTALYFFKIRKR